jgi:two-component system invasion response regulator UvrY
MRASQDGQEPRSRSTEAPRQAASTSENPSVTAVAADVYLVETYPISREGLRQILERAGHRVVGEADHPTAAVADIVRLNPMVVLVNLHLDHRSGMEVLEQVKRRNLSSRVVVLGSSTLAQHVAEAMKLGALGYVLKDAPVRELLETVEHAARGLRYLGPSVTDLAVDGLMDQTEAAGIAALSLRERQILMFVLRGRTSAAIADELCLSPKTVESYRSRMMLKLGVADLPALVRLAIRTGTISAND